MMEKFGMICTNVKNVEQSMSKEQEIREKIEEKYPNNFFDLPTGMIEFFLSVRRSELTELLEKVRGMKKNKPSIENQGSTKANIIQLERIRGVEGYNIALAEVESLISNLIDPHDI